MNKKIIKNAKLFYNVKRFSSLFKDCENLQELDLSEINNPDEIKEMSDMLKNCSSLENVDMTNIDTSNIKRLDGLFEDCTNLKSVNLSTWDTGDVKDSTDMFGGVHSINFNYANNNYGEWNISEEESGYSDNFPWNNNYLTIKLALSDSNANILTTLPTFTAKSSETIQYRFILRDGSASTDTNLKIKDVLKIIIVCDQSKYSKISFTNLTHIRNVDNLSINANWTSTENLFSGCTNLESVNFLNCNSSNVTNMNKMFYNCTLLDSVDLSSFNISKVTNLSNLFNNCKYLRNVNLSNWSLGNSVSCSNMFLNVPEISIVGWNYTGSNYTNFGKTESNTAYSHVFPWNKRMAEYTIVPHDGECVSQISFNLGRVYIPFYIDSNNTPVRFSETNTVIELKNGLTTNNFNVPTNDVEKIRVYYPSDAKSVKFTESVQYQTDEFELNQLLRIDISNFTDLSHMFFYCRSMESIDLSNWDTSKITDMSYMFEYCDSLTSITGLETWNVTNVTNMESMFYGCPSLTSLNINSWDVSNVVNMRGMFYDCTGLTTLDLSSWNTKNVKKCGYMLDNLNENIDFCYNGSNYTNFTLGEYQTGYGNTTYDIFPWNIETIEYTINASSSYSLTQYDNYVPSNYYYLPVIHQKSDDGEFAILNLNNSSILLTLTNGNTSTSVFTPVSDIAKITFTYSKAASQIHFRRSRVEVVEKLNITNKIKSINDMFYKTSYLTTIKGIENWDTSGVVDFGNAFHTATKLVGPLDLSNWVVSDKAKEISGLFYECKALKGLNVTGWNMRNKRYLTSIFYNCNELTYITGLETWDVSDATSFNSLFKGCSKVTELNISNWNTTKLQNMEDLFSDCYKIMSLDLSNWNTANVNTMEAVFCSCNALTTLNLSGWNTSKVTNLETFFYHCSALTTLTSDIENWDVSNVTNMRSTFYNCKLRFDLNNWDVSSLVNARSTFGLTSYTDLSHIKNWDVSNVTNMESMFCYCFKLTDISHIENWNTSNVTDMSSMFYECSKLVSVDLSNWDVSSVTTTDEMFRDCKALEYIDLTNWDIPNNISNTSYMFYNTKNLKTIVGLEDLYTGSISNFSYMFYSSGIENVDNINKWDTSSATNMREMFYGSSIKNIDISAWNTIKVINIGGMFSNCSKLEYANLANWNTASLTTMNSLFSSCSSLKYANLANWNTVKVTNMSNLFYYCNLLEYIDLSNWNTKKVTNYSQMFLYVPTSVGWNYDGTNYPDFNLTESGTSFSPGIFPWNMVTIAKYTFTSTTDTLPTFSNGFTYIKLDKVNSDGTTTRTIKASEGPTSISFESKTALLSVEELDTSNVTDMSLMFEGCTNLLSVDATGWNTSKVTTIADMFSNSTSLESIIGLNTWDTSSISNMESPFYGCTSLMSLDLSEWNLGNMESVQWIFYGSRAETINLTNWNFGNLTSLSGMFNMSGGYVKTLIGVNTWDTSKITNIDTVFFTCSKLTSVDVSGWDTSKVTSMKGVFESCRSLTSVDVSEWDTSKVTNMRSIFSNCSSLTSVDVSEWDTSKVTDIGFMFNNCSSLTSLDLSNFNTSKVNKTDDMFYGCTSLTSLDISNFDTSKVTTMTDMFYNVSELSQLHMDYCSTNAVTAILNVINNRSSTTPGTLYVTDSVYTSVKSLANSKNWYSSPETGNGGSND